MSLQLSAVAYAPSPFLAASVDGGLGPAIVAAVIGALVAVLVAVLGFVRWRRGVA